MAEQQLVAILGADVSQFQKAMKNVQGSMQDTAKTLDTSLNGAESDVKKGTKSMGDSFKQLGKIMATVFAIDKIIDFGVFAVKASAGLEAMNAQFEQVFGDLQGIAEGAIEDLSQEFGMLPNRIKPAMSSMTSQFKGLGLDTEEAMATASDAITIVADSAAFYDKSFEDANSSLNSFIKGNYEGGEAIGLFANETQMASWASQNLGVDWKNLDEAGKQVARLEFAKAMQEASGATGQASRESDNFENVLGNLRQAWTDFSAELAKPILPIVIGSMKGLVSILQTATGWVQNFNENFGEIDTFRQIQLDFMGGNFDKIGELIPQMVEKFLSEGGSFLGIGATLINNLAKGMGMSVPELMSAVVETVGSIIVGIVDSIPLILDTGVKMIEGLIDGLIQAIPMLTSSLGTVINSLISAIVSNLPKILMLGLELLTALVQGIILALPLLLEGVTQLINSFMTMVVENLPLIMETGMNLLQALLTGIMDNLELLITTLTTVLTTMVTHITENLPMILEMGIQLLVALIEGILESLPQMTNTILDLVLLITTVLLQNLPLIINAGIEVLLAVVKGIIDMLPTLITTIIELAFAIQQALLDNLPLLIQAGVELIFALMDGLSDSMPDLLAEVDDIILAIFQGFADVDWLQIGKDILSGIAKGVANNAKTVLNAIGGVAGDALAWGKKKLKAHSPSKVFEEEVGKTIPEGMALGISKESDVAIDAVNDLTNSLVPNSIGNLNSVPRLDDTDTGIGNVGSGEYSFTIPLIVEGREIARASAIFIGEELDKIQRKNNRLMGQYS